jgi:hypothetical protein
VVAVFRRSFYIRTATDRFLCIGGAGLGLGPLNLIAWDSKARKSGRCWSTGVIESGDKAEARRGVLRIGRALAFDGAELVGWFPRTPSGPVSSVALRLGLSRIISRACACAPSEGLGMLIPRLAGTGRHSSRLNTGGLIRAAALPAIESLENWLNFVRADGAAARCPFPDAARGLIGLGPGLTPSGDDFFGGLMIGLRDFGMARIAKTIWLGLQPNLTNRTNLISIAHLEAAAAGMGHSAVHAFLLALRSEEAPAIDRAVKDIAAIGHCSGWDAIAGLVLALRLVSEYQNVRDDLDLHAAGLM